MHELRQYYRIQYPEPDRPQLVLMSGVFPVIDCSEQGMRYRVRLGGFPDIGDTVSGSIRFHSGERMRVVGKVINLYRGDVALKLSSPGIPIPILFTEQRYLLVKYPGRRMLTPLSYQ